MKKITRFASVIFTFLFALTSCDHGTISSSTHEHTFASTWEYDETYHWHPSTCGHNVRDNEENHIFTYIKKIIK